MRVKLLSVLLLLTLLNCKQVVYSDLEAVVIKVKLEGTEFYEYKISESIPFEGGYEIRKQAENYQLSKMDWGKYQYQAKEGFKGFETVEIVLSTSIGDDNFTDQKKWIFQIQVI